MPLQPRGVYTARFSSVTVSAVQDLFQIIAPSDAVVSINKVSITCHTSSPTAEQLSISLKRVSGAPTNGSGGTTITPTSSYGSTPSTGVIIEGNNTTQSSGGTLEHLLPKAYNPVRSEAVWSFDDYEEIVLSPGQFFLLSLDDAPTGSIVLTGVLTFSEYGG